uniref:Uncharacterized protein n=1 Tax=Plectus sambesii TaxID=2011161 RepID=A0A914VBH7_9BILA
MATTSRCCSINRRPSSASTTSATSPAPEIRHRRRILPRLVAAATAARTPAVSAAPARASSSLFISTTK